MSTPENCLLFVLNVETPFKTVYIPIILQVYIGDVFLLEEKDVIRCAGLDVNTGLQIIVSAGLAVPNKLYANQNIVKK